MSQIGAASLLQIRVGVVTNWGKYYKLGKLLQIGHHRWFEELYYIHEMKHGQYSKDLNPPFIDHSVFTFSKERNTVILT